MDVGPIYALLLPTSLVVGKTSKTFGLKLIYCPVAFVIWISVFMIYISIFKNPDNKEI